MARVLQISDTHLSPAKRHFAANWAPLRDWVLLQNAELTIHTGDLTVDGADNEEDMRQGAKLMRSLPVPFSPFPATTTWARLSIGISQSTPNGSIDGVGISGPIGGRMIWRTGG